MLHGILIGVVIGLAIHVFLSRGYEQLLESKADPDCRTPENIGTGFYYIVPEKEFIQLNSDVSFWKDEANKGLAREGDLLRRSAVPAVNCPTAQTDDYPRLAE